MLKTYKRKFYTYTSKTNKIFTSKFLVWVTNDLFHCNSPNCELHNHNFNQFGIVHLSQIEETTGKIKKKESARIERLVNSLL